MTRTHCRSDCRKSKDTWHRRSQITYFRGDNSNDVQARAFIRGRTHFLLMYRRPAAISYARRNGFGESVIGHLWHTVPNRCVDRQWRAAMRCDRDVPRIRRDPPTCKHYFFAMRGLPILPTRMEKMSKEFGNHKEFLDLF